ncbi:MAG: DNA methylase [Phycisphaerales bacterium]|nr:DNA methylase [Phycisphaerales bacterium]
MAESPSHRFGQIIGEVLERAIRPVLTSVASDLGLYIDAKGERRARGARRKVTWVDGKGNAHELDYVFERGGSEEQVGSPRAFIEIAWRRYTKHSRNKAQEIQGAILPLAEHYSDCRPFLGVVLGGVFTEGSLNQLRSHGFSVLYFPYESVVAAFGSAGIDAAFEEDTADSVLRRKVRQYEKLPAKKRGAIADFLRKRHPADVERFTTLLRVALTRVIDSVWVLPLHGLRRTLTDLAKAINFIKSFDESKADGAFTRYDVGVRYNNGDEIRGQFQEKATAIAFLHGIR